jgi:hypothetical protein
MHEPFRERPLRKATLVAQPCDPSSDALLFRCHGGHLPYLARSRPPPQLNGAQPALQAFVSPAVHRCLRLEVIGVGLNVFAGLRVLKMHPTVLRAYRRESAHEERSATERYAITDVKVIHLPQSLSRPSRKNGRRVHHRLGHRVG